MNPAMLLSVIIPFYKVEKYIRRCAESLFEQTIEDVEYLFIDDCSPDRSIDILKETIERYPQRQQYIKIIRHPVNKGLPSARNTGLANATGKYVYHCDSDDWLEREALQEMVGTAERNQADMVWCDWFLSFEHNERYMKQPRYNTSQEMLAGLLSGTLKYNVWNKLAKRSLYTENGIVFPDGYSMGEDMTMIRLAACSQKACHVPHALYHYMKTNGEAFTSNFSKKRIDEVRHNVDETVRFLTEREDFRYQDEINFFKLNIKYPLLISDQASDYNEWKCLYPEANPYIWKNKVLSSRARILQSAARYGQFWILKGYYKIIYRFIYGFIYR